MLDQLRRLVNGSNGGQTDGIPPSGSARQSRYQQQQQHGHSSAGSTRSGSLSRLTAYALHPQHSGRMRMQLSYNVVPVSYVPPPPPPHPVAVAYGRNGRTTVVGYDPWFQVRYPQQPRTPVGRQLSSRPDLAPPPQQSYPPPPPSSHSSGKKKSSNGVKQSELSKERINKEEFRHPTIRRDTVVPNNRHRLVSSRSLDSIHPHRIHHHHRPSQEKQPESGEVKSSSKKMKEFFQRVKDSVSNSGTTNGHQSNRSGGGGQGQRTDEWLLLRPSVNANNSKPVPPPLQRPTTPGMTAFRKIFSRSPSPPSIPSGPLAPVSSNPIKKPLSSTKSLFQQIIRPRSRSVSSTASLSVNSTAHISGGNGGGAIRNFNRMMREKSKTDLNIVHRNDAGSIRRGNPDGATFPRDSPFHLAGTEESSSELLIYAPASEPAKSLSVMTALSNNSSGTNNNNNNNNNTNKQKTPSKKTKFVKKIEQPVAGFRVKRRQSQLRRSERKRRSSRHRSGRKKSSRNNATSSSGPGGGSSKKLGSSKGSQLGSQSALSGAKLVSDWTYLPLPTSFTPVDETAKPRATPESLKIVDPTQSKRETVATPMETTKAVVVAAAASSTNEDDDNGWESDLYQVLVDRGQPRRSGPLPPPMWDPLIFIPPERRRSCVSTTTIVLNESAILVADQQPWIRSSKLRADGKKQLRRINPPPPPPLSPPPSLITPPLSPSSSRSSSGTSKKDFSSLPPPLPPTNYCYHLPSPAKKCHDTLHLPSRKDLIHM